MSFDHNFWTDRWLKNKIGWDIGEVSTPLKLYFDQLENKSAKILIPGAGNAYEAEYLWSLGFKNVFVLDVSIAAVQSFSERCPHFPSENILIGDFFELKKSGFDLIIEQTFFCAINPNQREEYVKKVKEILSPDGKLVGVLFNCEFQGGPPFGGSKKEYLKYFKNNFKIICFDETYNSIQPRDGRELFMILKND